MRLTRRPSGCCTPAAIRTPAAGSGGQCSIQLSYRGTSPILTQALKTFKQVYLFKTYETVQCSGKILGGVHQDTPLASSVQVNNGGEHGCRYAPTPA
jgi:hypothetical protein